MRVCIIYDRLYPYTIGGAERWYVALAQHLAAMGDEVTYLTQVHRSEMVADEAPDVRVIGVCPVTREYSKSGRRRVIQPARFAIGVLHHLARHRQDYDVVHLCAFPYFSLLAARLALLGTPVTFGVDWFEVWSASYWRAYLGRLGGFIGERIQRACIHLSPTAFLFSDLHGERIRRELPTRRTVRLGGLYISEGTTGPSARPSESPYVLFAGRHIPEKGVLAIPDAVALARIQVPDLRCIISGDGPMRSEVARRVHSLALDGVIELPGFVDGATLRSMMRNASALLLPSRREGYGLVVIEAAAEGTPSIVVEHEDNAAVELIDPGQNGVVARSDSPQDLANAIVEVVTSGEGARQRTRAWFIAHCDAVAVRSSAQTVRMHYECFSGRT